jgi:hypothetical protein
MAGGELMFYRNILYLAVLASVKQSLDTPFSSIRVLLVS